MVVLIRGQRGQGGQAKKSFFKILDFLKKKAACPCPLPLLGFLTNQVFNLYSSYYLTFSKK
jgi:hypothetical protein